MFSSSRRNFFPYPYPRRRSTPGCFGLSVVLIGMAVCIWLTTKYGLFGITGMSQAPLFSIPLPAPPGSHNTVALAQPSHLSYQVMGKPSLTPDFINRVLAHAHSPAAGTGQSLYNLSVRYGIDDVYALAFFQHESALGTRGMAAVTLSLGNIRCTPGYQCLNGYRAYHSWAQGYEDWYRLIRTLYVEQWHLVTVRQIIPRYAPISDGNNVPLYIAAVEHAVDTWQRGEV